MVNNALKNEVRACRLLNYRALLGSSIDKELRLEIRIYKTRDLARADILEYIEMFYNQTRRHSHIGGISPEAFEQASK